MIIGGTWYQGMPSQQGTNIPYKLLDFGPTFVYSHLVIASKFPMLPCSTHFVLLPMAYNNKSMLTMLGNDVVYMFKYM
jgi:hypothetical protein